jgi:YidC/Oxa1 family membrane protein insertase
LNKRVLLSTGVALAFVLAWQFLFQPLFFPKKPEVPAAPVAAQGAPAAPSAPASAPAPASAAKMQDHPDAGPIVLESTGCRATFTNKGAGLQQLAVKVKGQPDAVLLSPHAGIAPHLSLRLVGGSEKLETLGWEVAARSEREVTFRCKLPSGVEIRKTFELAADAAAPTLKIVLSNPGTEAATVGLELLALNGLDHESDYRYEQYAMGVVHVKNTVQFKPLPDVLKGEEKLAQAWSPSTSAEDRKAAEDEYKALLSVTGGQKSWFGLKNRFFFAALNPDAVTNARIESVWYRGVEPGKEASFENRKQILASARFDAIGVAPGKEEVWTFAVAAGPLRSETLRALPGGGDMLNYGGGCAAGCGPLSFLFAPMVVLVNMVAPLILGVLTFLGGLFGNYGVGIICTTLVIRLCLFPLSRKSQVSMYRMQQLGPKITALRERYKDDQQKFGMEQMKLFRENKINPLSGCFPVLLQMPIFIAMYSVFELSVELRGQPFLWIGELSQPDHLVGPWVPWHINLLVTTLTIDAFNLLPIVMTATWFLQSYFAPRSPDPQMAAQQKMMMFMPVMFGLMCYNLASGLSLYFLVNSLLSMTEQKLIKKFFLPQEGGGPAPAR